jgi:hypothetical protein
MNYKDISFKKAEVVQNSTTYNREMRKSLIDKIFFLDKVGDSSVFIDYGCADGSVLKLASSIIPEASYIGYDISEEMLGIAIKSCDSTIQFTNDLDLLGRLISEQKKKGNKICISLLSLIHEVYAYGPDSVKKFWGFVFNTDLFDYIAIRDMCVAKTTSRPSDPISVAKIRMLYDKNMLSQWESTWGSLNENWSLTHFLLTYQYVDSWDRELHENYLPLCLEDLMALIPNGWKPTYLEHYTLPFVRQKVYEDFGMDLQDRTHVKIILERYAGK